MIKNFSIYEHLEKVQNIELECFGQGFSNEAFYHFYQILGNDFIVYEENNIIVGYCIGSLSKVENNIGWIVSIGVLPKFQKKDIGSKLIQNIIKKFSNQVKYLRLSVDKENYSAYKFYIKNGFCKIKQPHDMYHNGGKSYLLEYEL